MAQWKRAGPITQRSMDRNHPLLDFFLSIGGSLSFTSPCFPLQIQNRPCWFKNGTDTTLCHYPLIAQLVERRTVVGIVMQISLGRWFESGSRDYFFKGSHIRNPGFPVQRGSKKKSKNLPRVRLELTTFRSLLDLFHYETDALPTALPRHANILPSSTFKPQRSCSNQIGKLT